MGKIVAFTNQKGGVGKTTSAVNIAASVGILGKKVLMVDVDPQGNTTTGFGILKKELGSTVYDVLIHRCPLENAIYKTKFDNLWIAPANISLAGAEFELVSAEGREARLREALAGVRDQFDYIFVDCPPSLGILTMNALCAADGVLVPLQCEYYSLEGLGQLMMTVKRIRTLYNPQLYLVGILITMYNGRLNHSQSVLDALKRYYKDKLFATPIARNVKLSEAPSFGMPVYYYDRHSKGAELYLKVAQERMERI